MISVILPVYNVEKYLFEAIQSIERQTFKDFELIVINDGSTDNSLSIAEKKLKNSQLKWKIVNQNNKGLSAARNVGISEANGEYISFIDSDDEIDENFLSDLYFTMNKANSDLVFCGFKYIKIENNKIGTNSLKDDCNQSAPVIFNRNEILDVFLKREFEIIVPSFLIKKEFLQKNQILFEENARFSEDQIFMWKCFLNIDTAVYLSTKNYFYFQRSNSIMASTNEKKVITGFLALNKFVETEEIKESIKRYIIPRWVLGALYSASKSVLFDEFLSLYQAMDGVSLIKKMKGFPEKKAVLLSKISFNPKLLYLCCRYII
ncbi:MAG: glycosyltransferase family A protein [Bacilli bacterium]